MFLFLRSSCTLLLLIALVLSLEGVVTRSASAQVLTGTPAFGSFSGAPDVVNLANLNVHHSIPFVHKGGRGTDFTYDLSFDTSVWYPVTSGSTTSWQPVYNWGWRAQTEITTGYISFALRIVNCAEGGGSYRVYSGYSYHDVFGISHTFAGATIVVISGSCATNNSIHAVTPDGSGYTLDGSGAAVTVTTPQGKVLRAPVLQGKGSGSSTDRNGNMITVNTSGVFTDTLGTTALTVSGSGTPTSPLNFAYTAPSGATPSYVLNYTALTVQTKFSCSGITEYGPIANNLVTEIDLPDISVNPNDKYTLTYEVTPNDTHSPHYVTGRIASITLPSGGTISYSYMGANNGINCADGSAATLNRTTPDGTWVYAQTKGAGAASTTIVNDPQNNQTVIQFQGIYETQRQTYQGLTSGTLLQTTNTCYNNAASPCNLTAVSLPITVRSVIAILPGANNLQSKTVLLYNTLGLQTELDEYDFGSGAPASTPVRKTLTVYAVLGNGIQGVPASVRVQDSGGNIKAQTTYAYDESAITATTGTPQLTAVTGSRGNATTVKRYVDSVNFISSTATYFDTGNVQTSADVNGAATTYTYGACGNSFPTNISEPLSLSKSETWNCNGAVPLTTTDENGKVTTSAYSDAFFWRPVSVTDPSGAAMNYCYGLLSGGVCGVNPQQVETTLTFNSGNSTVDTLVTTDSLGRTLLQQARQSPSSGNFDTIETDYDSLGRIRRSTLPFNATAGQTNSSVPAQIFTYDALNRVAAINDSGGGNALYTYSQNDVFVTAGPAPTGENAKRRQLEYDALGRLTSVCEITSATGGGTCAQMAAQTGYWTKYTYNLLDNIMSVTQDAQAATGSQQSRSYAFDFLSRLTSETNPESGTSTYAYDSASVGVCNITSKGDLIIRTNAAGVSTCNGYDSLHRILSIGHNPARANGTPDKFFVYDSATVNATAMANAKGRLAEAYTCMSPCTKLTDEGFSYTVRGELSNFYELTPHSGSNFYYHTIQTYWPHGLASQLSSNISALPTFTYGGSIGSTVGLDGKGRVTQVTASSGQNPITGMTYAPYSTPPQLTANLGSGDSDVFSFDANTGRTTKYQFNVNGQSDSGTLTWNSNGSLNQLAITDALNSADSQTCTYTHDDLSRIASVNCGASTWQQNFGYDAFGNLTKTVPTGGTGNSFLPMYNSATNRFSSIPGTTVSYDVNGNVLSDGSHVYAWDADGHPSTIDGIGLTFDALGRMVEQNRSGSYTEFVYSPTGGKIALMTGQTLQKGLLPLPNGGQAVYNATGLLYYGHSDHLGSMRLGSTPSRAMYFDLAHAPFGETYATFGGSNLDPAFTSQRQDTTPGLFDFAVREYSTQGRWPSPDPAGLAAIDLTSPQSWNRYAYVSNKPLSLIDPLGTTPARPETRFGGGCGDEASGDCGGGGGVGCVLDGVDTSCSTALAQISNGSAAQCPDNDCHGVRLIFASGSQGIFQKWVAPHEWETPGHDALSPTFHLVVGFWQFAGYADFGQPGWWSTFFSTYGNGLVNGVRDSGESFGSCMDRNVRQTTFGTVDPKALTNKALNAATTAAAVLGSIPARTLVTPEGNVGTLNGIQEGAISLARTLGLGLVGSRLVIGGLTGAGYTLAVAGAATAGLTIGSAINCM